MRTTRAHRTENAFYRINESVLAKAHTLLRKHSVKSCRTSAKTSESGTAVLSRVYGNGDPDRLRRCTCTRDRLASNFISQRPPCAMRPRTEPTFRLGSPFSRPPSSSREAVPQRPPTTNYKDHRFRHCGGSAFRDRKSARFLNCLLDVSMW